MVGVRRSGRSSSRILKRRAPAVTPVPSSGVRVGAVLGAVVGAVIGAVQ